MKSNNINTCGTACEIESNSFLQFCRPNPIEPFFYFFLYCPRASTAMEGGLVFITGATGLLGHRVLIDALQAGYRVRAAVRSKAKGDTLLDIPTIKTLKDQLELVIVADILADDAYNEAVKGATHIIHMASPMPVGYKGEDLDEFFIQPAVKSALNILNAAQSVESVKRVIFTASVLSIFPFQAVVPGTPENALEYNEQSRTPSPPGPFTGGPVEAYAASKVTSLNEVEAWVASKKPSFDLVSFFPGFIFGSNELVTNPKVAFGSTNALLLGPVVAGTDSNYLPGVSVDVSDASLAHLKALNASVPGNRGYLLTTGADFEQEFDIVARNFPAAVSSGLLPNNGKFASVHVKVDASESERILGFKLKSFEEQVKNTVGQYVQLAEAAA
jgi:nucleoside-diphosphate-sugar epimerase